VAAGQKKVFEPVDEIDVVFIGAFVVKRYLAVRERVALVPDAAKRRKAIAPVRHLAPAACVLTCHFVYVAGDAVLGAVHIVAYTFKASEFLHQPCVENRIVRHGRTSVSGRSAGQPGIYPDGSEVYEIRRNQLGADAPAALRKARAVNAVKMSVPAALYAAFGNRGGKLFAFRSAVAQRIMQERDYLPVALFSQLFRLGKRKAIPADLAVDYLLVLRRICAVDKP